MEGDMPRAHSILAPWSSPGCASEGQALAGSHVKLWLLAKSSNFVGQAPPQVQLSSNHRGYFYSCLEELKDFEAGY